MATPSFAPAPFTLDPRRPDDDAAMPLGGRRTPMLPQPRFPQPTTPALAPRAATQPAPTTTPAATPNGTPRPTETPVQAGRRAAADASVASRAEQRMGAATRDYDRRTPGVVGASSGGAGPTPDATWRKFFPTPGVKPEDEASTSQGQRTAARSAATGTAPRVGSIAATPPAPAPAPAGATPAQVADYTKAAPTADLNLNTPNGGNVARSFPAAPAPGGVPSPVGPYDDAKTTAALNQFVGLPAGGAPAAPKAPAAGGQIADMPPQAPLWPTSGQVLDPRRGEDEDDKPKTPKTPQLASASQ